MEGRESVLQKCCFKIRWSYLPLAATVRGISFIVVHREKVEADAGGFVGWDLLKNYYNFRAGKYRLRNIRSIFTMLNFMTKRLGDSSFSRFSIGFNYLIHSLIGSFDSL